jgi:starch phosphorylase
VVPEPLQPLVSLARNLWWTWTPAASELFRQIDPHRWDRTHHNPMALLRDLEACEPGRFEQLVADPSFMAKLRAVHGALQAYLHAPTWHAAEVKDPKRVAYFSMEFGLHASLKTYSGGLGVLAGDHLKSASDLGVPLVGVTLFYHQGYFRQVIDDGVQLAAYPQARLDRLPFVVCTDKEGRPLELSMKLGPYDARFGVLRLDVGRTRLYLLDADRDGNPEAVRRLTRSLYGGDDATRVLQEVLLGVGGVRALRALGELPEVYHMNEGHCAFVAVELLRELTDAGVAPDDAVVQVRSRCVFTTHTPVPAGHDRFSKELVHMALGPLCEAAGWPEASLMDLGRVREGDVNESLCMTVVAMKLSHSTNGVSAKHGEVSREMWRDLWPHKAAADIPIGHVTNGVHPVYWMAPESQVLFDAYVPGWRDRPWDPAVWRAGLEHAPCAALWSTRNALRQRLADFMRARMRVDLDPHALTIGFARRFATYKRGDLLFSEPDRLHRLLAGSHPVQIVYAGKAHPKDLMGQAVLARVLRWADDPRFRGRVFFVEDYDMDVGAALTGGVDVWLNNPRRPLEASGTSGQKVCLNLGLNLSVLDGWWLEGFDGTNGWAVGGEAVTDDAAMDREDALALYQVLEDEVLPMWMDRDPRGIPLAWMDRVKASTITCASLFNSHRMVKDYVQRLYRVCPVPPPRVEAP